MQFHGNIKKVHINNGIKITEYVWAVYHAINNMIISWIIPLMTCSKYQFRIFRALAYLLIKIVYLITIDLRKETGTDQ